MTPEQLFDSLLTATSAHKAGGGREDGIEARRLAAAVPLRLRQRRGGRGHQLPGDHPPGPDDDERRADGRRPSRGKPGSFLADVLDQARRSSAVRRESTWSTRSTWRRSAATRPAASCRRPARTFDAHPDTTRGPPGPVLGVAELQRVHPDSLIGSGSRADGPVIAAWRRVRPMQVTTPRRDDPAPLPRPPGDHDAGRCRRCSSSRRCRPTRQSCARTNRSCIVLWMGGRPQPPGHLGPQARQREERRPVQADRHLGAGREDQRAPAQGGQADASPEHHPLAQLQGGEPRPRHVHDAHRATRPTRRWSTPASGRSARYELGEQADELRPAALHLDQHARGWAAGFLGMSYSPFVVQNPNAPIANLQAAQGRRSACGWSGGWACSARSRTQFISQRKSPGGRSTTRRSTPRPSG